MRNAIDLWKRYGTFSKVERKELFLSIVVITFIFWFSALNIQTTTAASAFESVLKTVILVSIAFLGHELSHRSVALFFGLQAEYKAWRVGLIVSAVITFFTGLVVIAPGAVVIHTLKTHRLGHMRYALNMRTMSVVALAGPMANVALAIIFKAFSLIGATQFFMYGVSINIFIAAFNLIPFPPFDGSKIFFGTRNLYLFAVIFTLLIGGLLYTASPLLSLLGALAVAALATLAFFIFVDKALD